MIAPVNTTAIILAAGPTPPSLVSLFGKTSPAMIPVSGRPCIHWTLSHLVELGVRSLVLGVRPGETRLQKFVTQAFANRLSIEFVEPSEDRGPGFTLLECLKRLPDSSSALVVLGDTIFALPENADDWFSESFALLGPVDDSIRWCLAEVKDGKISRIADKPESNPDTWPALIGVYYLKNIAPVRSALDAAARGKGAIQLRHALAPLIENGALAAHEPSQWIDCGNIDFLTSARRRLIGTRNFNSMQVDELRGTVTKRSKHRAKFVNEINYYRLLPPEIAVFFPRLAKFSISQEDTFADLEYYGYPTLSELWVFDEFDAPFWKRIFTGVSRVVECFAAYPMHIQSRAVFNFYWNKTAERLADFEQSDSPHAALVRAREISVNGRPQQGWPLIADAVRTEIERLSQNTPGQIIHGDLCFPNILFDPISKFFKFVDPRGSFAESGIFGDARYDVAKLMHSIHGGYDFLIHDMFSARRDGTSLEIAQFFPSIRQEVLDHFADVFGQRFAMRDVRFLEGLLFLSMCPLHADAPQRQLAMFGIGLRILNETLHENLH